MDRPGGRPDAEYVSGVAPPTVALICRVAALRRMLLCDGGVLTENGSTPLMTQLPAALLHRLCIPNVPVDSVTSPNGSGGDCCHGCPPQAHLSPISPPLKSFGSYQAVKSGSVIVS